jgi:ectoine hydroxylase-related dioxygenase (phytanoyl-CoA dioxygenase family)
VAGDLAPVAAAFRRDGACVVRGLLDEAQVARLAQGVEENLAAPSERAIEGGGEAGAGRFFEDFRNWTRIAPYEEVIRGSRIGAVAAQLMDSRTARLHHDHLLGQGARHDAAHAVAPGPALLQRRRLRHRLVLDPAGPGAAREHPRVRRGLARLAHVVHAAQLLRRSRAGLRRRDLRGGARRRGRPRAHDILGWELEPGDAVAFNMLTLHAAAGSRNRRRAFSVRLVGDDVRFAARPHATSPAFPELEGVLAHGDELDHPLFPRLFGR